MATPNITTNAIPVFAVDGVPSSPNFGQPIAAAGTISLPEYEDAQVFAGNGYTANTQIVSVAAGSFFVAELSNPAGSGVNFVMTSRAFSDNIIGGNAPLEYDRYNTAATIPASPAPTVATINNRITGGPASVGTFRYVVATTAPTGGAITSAGFVPVNGDELRIKDIVVIAPGNKLIYVVRGAGGGLAAAARIKMTFLFYTRAI